MVGIVGSHSIDDNFLKMLENAGFMAIAPGDTLMDLLNSSNFVPKE